MRDPPRASGRIFSTPAGGAAIKQDPPGFFAWFLGRLDLRFHLWIALAWTASAQAGTGQRLSLGTPHLRIRKIP